MGHNAADPAQVKRVKREQQERHERDMADLRALLAEEHGRRFIARILRETRQFDGNFTGNNTTFYYEGRRDVGLPIVHDLLQVDAPAFAALVRDELQGSEQ